MNKEPEKKRAKLENDENKIDKDSVKELSDEELDKVAGGLCPADCVFNGGGCDCPDFGESPEPHGGC